MFLVGREAARSLKEMATMTKISVTVNGETMERALYGRDRDEQGNEVGFIRVNGTRRNVTRLKRSRKWNLANSFSPSSTY